MDYAPNFTPRVRVKYKSHEKTHTLTVRPASNDTGGFLTAVTLVDNILTLMKPLLDQGSVILGADYAVEDSDVFLPLNYNFPLFAAKPPSTIDPDRLNAASYVSFQGISALGTRTQFFVYGINRIHTHPAMDNFRFEYGEQEEISDVIDLLLSSSAALRAIDKQGIIWRTYANYGFNAYYQRMARRG